MDPLWIVAAFIFGATSSRIGLPPLVGYLIAGFVLNGFGIEGSYTLGKIADTGVTLLLFTIGLKQEGVDAAYSLYEEAGVGFADHISVHMDHCHLQDTGLTS